MKLEQFIHSFCYPHTNACVIIPTLFACREVHAKMNDILDNPKIDGDLEVDRIDVGTRHTLVIYCKELI